MRDPAFWWQPPGLAASLLSPLAAAYGAVAAARLRQGGQRCGIPVICVGNPTLGGAGKTPTALAIGELLKLAGARPYFLSRGYGGQVAGPLLVDPVRHGADLVGDEPLLLARVAPTIIAHNRIAGAAMAREGGASVVVMDDGFQNPSLAKDLSILVVDGRRGLGNGYVFPAGPLRAPLEAQLRRAQALVVVGYGDGAAAVKDDARRRNIPVFAARLDADIDDIAALAGKPVLAFAGIGDPEKFFATLTTAGIDVRVRRMVPDHYAYTAGDSAVLLTQARSDGLTLVTTEKDMARLVGNPETAELANTAHVLRVTLQVEDRAGFAELIRKAVRTDDGAASPPRG